ncbi:peptidylprolyl isomerase [Spirosoma linguale]|uniref:PpiC-type peptidyl-prolyl cis-trans isomerase n=1 Tax=Spirosoma linguale (strain ATCC 33905 / DSM 74 / LMG 10896 / Claus 1) TaxID=504472 RepID=D2QTA7_SPILD|nr:PpiC-type peptidyl-prolyl cis-trans isomerase [Spirosoma linguale DSM 74]
MKLYFLLVILLVLEASHSLYGQTLPETNNKTHYTDRTANREIARLYRKLKAGYAFDKLALEYSQDYGSFTAGGKLGWQKPDIFVPEFNQVISQMSKDQFSKPFKTEFGYHIVQLLDKKPGEVLTRHILLKVDS